MKIYSKRKVVQDYLEKEICDWCGEEVGYPDIYRTNDFTLEYRVGTCYPECADGVKVEVDLCFNCRKKLMEELKKLGINIREEQYWY